jgi:hypothetical protein
MTAHELADVLEGIARALRQHAHKLEAVSRSKPVFEDELLIGAAIFGLTCASC